ncbi:hypothetical protein B0O99DRAFT_521427 [Bisporella sp. PMI_857]|nr:hypothetical protein B0O99DRAFT_521427 [Bisporella sp. PMI_857]
MPNHPAISGAIVVVGIAVAAAIAVYESPQARQFAEDVRRKIAIALHSLGDEINPRSGESNQEPRFNRPEDAEGFMQSGAAAGVDADEESRRRQREELMYWNALRLEKIEREKAAQQSAENEKTGTTVLNTGADVNHGSDEGLRSRGVRGLDRSVVYANPFADEHQIDWDEQRAIDASLMSPDASEKFDITSQDLYAASEAPRPAAESHNLIDTTIEDPPVSYPTIEDLESSRNFTNMAPRDDSAFASIHAWADHANHSFYSPLPTTPRAASPSPREDGPSSPLFTDPPESVPGDLTPTYSASVADSAEEVWAPRSGATSEGGADDIESVGSSAAISTPGSWTEVGSVRSEDDGLPLAQ